MPANPFPDNYTEKVYSGVLGKIIGVYLGRPFEGWSHERIVNELGSIEYYVHDRLGVPLVVADDDISGTFTFLRGLDDFDTHGGITSDQIGKTWLNYIIEGKTILWWGGIGQSTEHTAFLNLKQGIAAPQSGSITQNGLTVAEQIGAQIFIDGWGMVCPGDTFRAAELARTAARVSHDGEAVHAAVVVAVMVSGAFIENSVYKLIELALTHIPLDCLIARLIRDIQSWYSKDYIDGDRDSWKSTLARIQSNYGYDKFPGNCHVVPNHALIILALLFGNGDFDLSMEIVNTSGWDTDCNSGNVGAILGVLNGLDCFSGKKDWRGPVADQILIPTADGASCVTDAVKIAKNICNLSARLYDQPDFYPEHKWFDFTFQGSTQGFKAAHVEPNAEGKCIVRNISDDDKSRRGLKVTIPKRSRPQIYRVYTPTFPDHEQLNLEGYGLVCCPTVFAGQTVEFKIRSINDGELDLRISPYVQDGNGERPEVIRGKTEIISKDWITFSWKIPELTNGIISVFGLEISASAGELTTIEVEYVDRTGNPSCDLLNSDTFGSQAAGWINAVDVFEYWNAQVGVQIIQNRGVGIAAIGGKDWCNSRFSATVSPKLAKRWGLVFHYQGLERYYFVQFTSNEVAIVRNFYGENVIARKPFVSQWDQIYEITVAIENEQIAVFLDGASLISAAINEQYLTCGGVGYYLDAGRITTTNMHMY